VYKVGDPIIAGNLLSEGRHFCDEKIMNEEWKKHELYTFYFSEKLKKLINFKIRKN